MAPKRTTHQQIFELGLGIVLKLLMVTVTHDLYRYLYLETPDWFKHYKSPFSVCKMLGAKLQAPLEPPGIWTHFAMAVAGWWCNVPI